MTDLDRTVIGTGTTLSQKSQTNRRRGHSVMFSNDASVPLNSTSTPLSTPNPNKQNFDFGVDSDGQDIEMGTTSTPQLSYHQTIQDRNNRGDDNLSLSSSLLSKPESSTSYLPPPPPPSRQAEDRTRRDTLSGHYLSPSEARPQSYDRVGISMAIPSPARPSPLSPKESGPPSASLESLAIEPSRTRVNQMGRGERR